MRQLLELNGVKINLEIQGSGQPLVLLHGFTGSAASWNEIASGLSQHNQVIAIDALGHGLSSAPADPGRYSMKCLTDDFISVLDALGLEKVNLLGYSMGGRMALHIATAAPQRINNLVLESATPGLRSEQERSNRRQSDELLAETLEQKGLQYFIDYWEQLPLFSSQHNLPASKRVELHEQRLRNNPRGLANSLRGVGTGMQEPLWDKLGGLNLKTLIIVGDLDKKFENIGQEMLQMLPMGQIKVWKDCGHTVHLESPDLFVKTVSKFIGN